MDCRQSLVIGPRTRKNILKGKNVRKEEDGFDDYRAYWTDSSDENSSVTSTKSNYSDATTKVDKDLSNAVVEEQQATFVSAVPNNEPEILKSSSAELENTANISKPHIQESSLLLKEVSEKHPLISEKSIMTRKTARMQKILPHPVLDDLDLKIMQMCHGGDNITGKNKLSQTHKKDANVFKANKECLENPKSLQEKKISKERKESASESSDDVEYDLELLGEKLQNASSCASPHKRHFNKKQVTPDSSEKAESDVTLQKESNLLLQVSPEKNNSNISSKTIASGRLRRKSLSASPNKLVKSKSTPSVVSPGKNISNISSKTTASDRLKRKSPSVSPNKLVKSKPTSSVKYLRSANKVTPKNDSETSEESSKENFESEIAMEDKLNKRPQISPNKSRKIDGMSYVKASVSHEGEAMMNINENYNGNIITEEENLGSDDAIKQKLRKSTYTHSNKIKPNTRRKSTLRVKSLKKVLERKSKGNKSSFAVEDEPDISVKKKTQSIVSPNKTFKVSNKVKSVKASTDSITHKNATKIYDIRPDENILAHQECSASHIDLNKKSWVSNCASPSEHNVSQETDADSNISSSSKSENFEYDNIVKRVKRKLPFPKNSPNKRCPEISIRSKSNLQSSTSDEDFCYLIERNPADISPIKSNSKITNIINSSSHNNASKNSSKPIQAINETYDCIDNLSRQISTRKRKSNENDQINSTKKTECKKKHSKKSKKILNSEEYLRKSNRQRFPPLAHWRNERLQYRWEKGEIKILGVDKGTNADDFAFQHLFKKYHKSVGKKKKLPKPKKAGIINIAEKKISFTDVIKKFSLTPWNISEKEMEKIKRPYLIKRMFETEKSAFGFLQLEVNKGKPEQYMPEEDLHMTVIRGNVELSIQKNSYVISEKDMFIIPRSCAYSIKNVGSIKAILSYVVGKFQFLENLEA